LRPQVIMSLVQKHGKEHISIASFGLTAVSNLIHTDSSKDKFGSLGEYVRLLSSRAFTVVGASNGGGFVLCFAVLRLCTVLTAFTTMCCVEPVGRSKLCKFSRSACSLSHLLAVCIPL
jgi:hypothetical protein